MHQVRDVVVVQRVPTWGSALALPGLELLLAPMGCFCSAVLSRCQEEFGFGSVLDPSQPYAFMH